MYCKGRHGRREGRGICGAARPQGSCDRLAGVEALRQPGSGLRLCFAEAGQGRDFALCGVGRGAAEGLKRVRDDGVGVGRRLAGRRGRLPHCELGL